MNILYIIVIFIVNLLLTYNVHLQGKIFYNNRIQEGKTNPKVYDIGMRYIPDLSKHVELEYLVHAIPVVLPFIFGKMILLTFLQLSLYLYMIRTVFINLTILPKHKHCDDTSFSVQSAVIGHCYDKVFSGHFAAIALIVMLAYGAGLLSNIIIPIIILVSYGILIIALRFHYTIDIAVAVLVAYVIYINKRILLV